MASFAKVIGRMFTPPAKVRAALHDIPLESIVTVVGGAVGAGLGVPVVGELLSNLVPVVGGQPAVLVTSEPAPEPIPEPWYTQPEALVLGGVAILGLFIVLS